MDHKVSKDMISSGMIPSGEKTQADLGRTQYGSAPSPSKLMDAYKSIYGNKEEVINEMSGMGMTPNKVPAPAPAVKKEAPPAPAKKEPPKATSLTSQTLSPEIAQKTDKDVKREKLKKIMADNESVDLLAAYRSVYEHHKKDADGNTIPHEGEELNEVGFLAPLLGGLTGVAGKAAVGAGAKAAAGAAAKSAAGMGTFGKAAASAGKVAGTAGKTAMTTGAKVTGSGGQMLQGPAVKKGLSGAVDKFKKMDSFQKYQTYEMGKDALKTAGSAVQGVKGATTVRKGNTGTVSADVDLFDIVKGQLLDEGLTEEEIKDIMLTLTPDEIMKEIEESSMSDGSAGGAYQDLGPGGFRSREQINTMHNDPKGTEKYGKKIMKRVGQAVKDTGTPTVRKVDESKK